MRSSAAPHGFTADFATTRDLTARLTPTSRSTTQIRHCSGSATRLRSTDADTPQNYAWLARRQAHLARNSLWASSEPTFPRRRLRSQITFRMSGPATAPSSRRLSELPASLRSNFHNGRLRSAEVVKVAGRSALTLERLFRRLGTISDLVP